MNAKGLLGLWFGLDRSVSAKVYLLSGLGLFLVKYGVDAGVVYAVAGEFVDPLLYLSPLISHRGDIVGRHHEWLLAFMALWALPFVWIGLSMSIRRAWTQGFRVFGACSSSCRGSTSS